MSKGVSFCMYNKSKTCMLFVAFQKAEDKVWIQKKQPSMFWSELSSELEQKQLQITYLTDSNHLTSRFK